MTVPVGPNTSWEGTYKHHPKTALIFAKETTHRALVKSQSIRIYLVKPWIMLHLMIAMDIVDSTQSGQQRQRHFPYSSTPLAKHSHLLAHLCQCELFVHILIAMPEPLKHLFLQVKIGYALSCGPFLDIQLLWKPFFQNSSSSVKTLGASNFAKPPLQCVLQLDCELFCLMIHLH